VGAEDSGGRADCARNEYVPSADADADTVTREKLPFAGAETRLDAPPCPYPFLGAYTLPLFGST